MLKKIMQEHNVATTALLSNFWKREAKMKKNWPSLCIEEGVREKDLFKDDLMEHFIDPAIQIEAEQRLDKRMWLPLATRTRFFRRTVSRAVRTGIQQVIILGSGLDTLAARKAKYTKDFAVKFFEIDQEKILSCKEAIYKEHQIDKNADYIPLDYVQGHLIEELIKRCFDLTRPTLILWEGNTFYLEKSDVVRILRELVENFMQIVITFDYMHASMQTSTQQLDQASQEKCLEKTLENFAQKKSPFKTFFAPAEIISICHELGIRCVDHKTAAELAREYEVDQKPYYTAEPYSMITFERR